MRQKVGWGSCFIVFFFRSGRTESRALVDQVLPMDLKSRQCGVSIGSAPTGRPQRCVPINPKIDPSSVTRKRTSSPRLIHPDFSLSKQECSCGRLLNVLLAYLAVSVVGRRMNLH